MRIYEIARAVGMPSRGVLEFLRGVGISRVRTASSAVPNYVAQAAILALTD